MLSNIRSRGAEPSCQLTSAPGHCCVPCCVPACSAGAARATPAKHRGADKLPKTGVRALTPSGVGLSHPSAQLCEARGCSCQGGAWTGWLVPWVSWGRKNQHQQGQGTPGTGAQGTKVWDMLSPGPILPTSTVPKQRAFGTLHVPQFTQFTP